MALYWGHPVLRAQQGIGDAFIRPRTLDRGTKGRWQSTTAAPATQHNRTPALTAPLPRGGGSDLSALLSRRTRPRMRPAAAPFILRKDWSWRGRGAGSGFSFLSARPLGLGMWRPSALLSPCTRWRAIPPLALPSERRVPTCSQHQQLSDQSGPPPRSSDANRLAPSGVTLPALVLGMASPAVSPHESPPIPRCSCDSDDTAGAAQPQGTAFRLIGRHLAHSPVTQTPLWQRIGCRYSTGGPALLPAHRVGGPGGPGCGAMGGVRWAFPCAAWRPRREEWLLAARLVQPEEKERIGSFVYARDAKAALVHTWEGGGHGGRAERLPQGWARRAALLPRNGRPCCERVLASALRCDVREETEPTYPWGYVWGQQGGV